MRLVSEVEKVAASLGSAFSAQVINRDSGWPLPWYWRALPKVGYQMEVPGQVEAPVIIVEADQLPSLKARLGSRADAYAETGPYGLRPGVHLWLLVSREKTAASATRAAEPAPLNLPVPAGDMPAPSTISTPPTLTPNVPVLPSLPLQVQPASPPQP
jgi:hypothetical protein